MDKYRDYIEFILDGKLHRLNLGGATGIPPTTTLLKYLRGAQNHKGAKEGCAQGDCGACTVVFAEVTNGRLSYKAVNSCLVLLPQIHGKHVITVENLQQKDILHPVQQAMVDMDASQCGFCTPGFVMSLFALHKEPGLLSDKRILDAFAGNLCRCTGYESILMAARQALKNTETDIFSKNETETIKILAGINRRPGYFEHEGQRFFQPKTITDATHWLNDNPQFEKTSGSTDVALRITKNKEPIRALIDFSLISELKSLKDTPHEFIIGSGVTLQEIKHEVSKHFPALEKMLSVFGSKQIRQLATLGGSLGSASPISDTAPVLIALDAKIELVGINGTRVLPLNKLFIGYRKTVLKQNELIKRIIIPKIKKNIIVDAIKVSKRVNLDIATVSAAMRLKLDSNNNVEQIVLVYGGMAEQTGRAIKTETKLLGGKWGIKNIEEAAAELESDFSPISDARASAAGRMQIAKNILIKFWLNSRQNHL